MNFEIYKRGQGKWTRLITFLSGTLIAALIAEYIWSEMKVLDWPLFVLYGIPVVIVLVVAAMMFWVVNRPANADFMIATEGEMKKVSWSSRRELIGGTKVVVATTLIMALLLWSVDVAFGFFFKWVGVLQLGD